MNPDQLITNPPLAHAQININVREFNNGRPDEEKIGASQFGNIAELGRLYSSQIIKSRHIVELTPENIPGFQTYIGGIQRLMQCKSKKTVHNRLEHYEKCGVIIKRENHGKNGIRLWFHPDIIFKNQDGYAHFTGSERFYTASHTEAPKTAADNTSTTGSPETSFEITGDIVEEPSSKNGFCPVPENAKSVNFTPNSTGTTGTVNTNTTVVNKLITTDLEQLEGVPSEQDVLPVPSSVGKGEDTGTPTGTRKSCPEKNRKQGKVAPIRALKNGDVEPPIPQKDTMEGAGRAFLLDRVKNFWEYAKKILYPGIILIECEEKRILNYIWASVFLKTPPGHTEDDWWFFYQRACKRVDKVGDWLELNPAFELPGPIWYFDPKNTRGVRFAITEQWLLNDERKGLMTKIKREVNDYAKGKGRWRMGTPLELFRRHEKLVAMRKDGQLTAMFAGLKGSLYGRLKMKEKF